MDAGGSEKGSYCVLHSSCEDIRQVDHQAGAMEEGKSRGYNLYWLARSKATVAGNATVR
jgi:hypothetical protein